MSSILSSIIGIVIFLPLLTVGMAQLLWSVGARWPIADRALLARTVVGTASGKMPNKLVTLVFALFLLGAAVCAFAVADHTSGGWWLTLIGTILAALFLVRGVIGFTAAWQDRHPAKPYDRYNRSLYSPMSLAIGTGFLLLVIMRLI